ncbi:MAG: ACP phosphodiesterase [Bacteroidales bacterium]
MNLLAHLFLSGSDEQIKLGNFFADAVKGKQKQQYSRKIQQGIQLHIAIDQYTDQHDEVKKSVKLLRNNHHKYAGVIIDLVYDHFLANHWGAYSTNKDLSDFIQHSYALLLKNYRILPDRTKRFLPYMIINNWLWNYQSLSGLDKSLSGLARRTTFDSGMEHAIKEVKVHYDALERHFSIFFPEIIAFVRGNPAVKWEHQ